ncbi:MAG: homocysteine S-methyltransferase family protein, partial [Rubrobacteraceae bacterium]|nr:homocysteine S-methyltransferase family protein [Rubrobacteraceae bacterium]
MKTNLREYLDGRVLVGDGAMGTLLAERGVGYGHPYARANLTHPDLVRRAHEEYVRAGARAIETNTFAASRIKLAEHALEDRVREIN